VGLSIFCPLHYFLRGTWSKYAAYEEKKQRGEQKCVIVFTVLFNWWYIRTFQINKLFLDFSHMLQKKNIQQKGPLATTFDIWCSNQSSTIIVDYVSVHEPSHLAVILKNGYPSYECSLYAADRFLVFANR